MDIENLSDKELQQEFWRINNAYLSATRGTLASYVNNPEFISIRDELHNVLGELKARRCAKGDMQ